MKLSEADAPVSIEAHYQVLRFVENSVIAELQKSDHAWLPVGARVSYSVIDEDDNMVGAPFELECGYTRPLDEAPIVEVDDAALYEIVDAPSDSDPLSIEFVDELRAAAQSQLQASAEQRPAHSSAQVLRCNGRHTPSLPCPRRIHARS